MRRILLIAFILVFTITISGIAGTCDAEEIDLIGGSDMELSNQDETEFPDSSDPIEADDEKDAEDSLNDIILFDPSVINDDVIIWPPGSIEIQTDPLPPHYAGETILLTVLPSQSYEGEDETSDPRINPNTVLTISDNYGNKVESEASLSKALQPNYILIQDHGQDGEIITSIDIDSFPVEIDTPAKEGSYTYKLFFGTSDGINSYNWTMDFVDRPHELQLTAIPLESGYIENNHAVYGNRLPFVGRARSGEPISGFFSFEIPQELLNSTINQVLLTLNFNDPIGLIAEEPDFNSFVDEYLILDIQEQQFDYVDDLESAETNNTCNARLCDLVSKNYSITPEDGGALISKNPDTGVVEQASTIEAFSIPCSELEQTLEIEVSSECTEILQECVNDPLCDRWVFTLDCSELPQNPIEGDAYGCHYNASLIVEYTLGEDNLTEADQTEEDATEGIGLGITEYDGQPGFEILEVIEGSPANIAHIQTGQWIDEVNGELLYDSNFLNIYNVNEVAEMIKTGKKGSRVVIGYSDSDFTQFLMAVLTRQ